MRELFINSIWQKSGDTSRTYIFTLTDEQGYKVSFNDSDNVVVKMGNKTGYLKDVDCKVTDKAINVDSKQFKDLPSDYYYFEVWVTDENGRKSIYPDDGTKSIYLANNIENVNGKVISTVTIDELRKEIASSGSTSVPGPPGPVGPQGIQGEAGPQGRDGRVGDSAYQTAVNYGFKGSELDWLKSLTPDTSTYTKYDQYHSYVDSVEKLREQLNDFKNAELTVSLERARPHTLSILTDNDGNSYYEFDNGCIINFKTLGKNADVTGYGKSDNQYITQFNYQRVDSDLRSIMSGALTLDAIKNASPTDFYAFADMVVSNPVNNNLDKYLFETGYISNQNHGPSSQAGELNFIKVLYQLGLISEDNLGPVYHVAKKP